MQKKSIVLSVLLVLVMIATMTSCASPAETPAAEAPEAPAEVVDTGPEPLKVAFIPNQRIGDGGPIDGMVEGLDKAVADFGIEAKKLESIDAAGFEDDIRAMASEGYDLIITTFGYMQEPMNTVAQEFPDTKFAGVYQDTNLADPKIDNVWGTSFQGGATFYITGFLAGKITKTGKIGMIPGAEEPGPNSEANAFMQGVKAANPDAEVLFAFVGSYEDPAKAKEIAAAMIAEGVDVIQGDAGATDAGIVEAAKESGKVVVFSCVGAYPEYDYFAGTIRLGFGDTVYDAVKMAVDGDFPGGTNGLRDITNNGYYLEWSGFESFATNNPDFGEAMTAALPEAKSLEAKFLDGSMVDNYDTTTPSWDRIKETPYE